MNKPDHVIIVPLNIPNDKGEDVWYEAEMGITDEMLEIFKQSKKVVDNEQEIEYLVKKVEILQKFINNQMKMKWNQIKFIEMKENGIKTDVPIELFRIYDPKNYDKMLTQLESLNDHYAKNGKK